MKAEVNETALYLRLSKEDLHKLREGDESASIRNQRLLLQEYAKRQGYEIVQIYTDDDESGLYDDRPAFRRLLADARKGRFSIVLAKSQSRFSRNAEHIERYLHGEFPRLGIRFIGVTDGTDTAEPENKKARQVYSLVNEWYCEDLSENIRSVLQAKMRKGEYLGASCPYGYQKNPSDSHLLQIDAYAADIVRRIFSLYQQGYGKGKIASLLSEEGVLIPTRYKQEVQKLSYHHARLLPDTKAWSAQTIHHILNNPMYLGHMVQHRMEKRSYKEKTCRSVPKSDWIVAKDTHPPIISEEQYALVQQMQRTRSRPVRTSHTADVFQGKLICADCGKKLCRAYQRRGDHAFIGYICRTYHTQGKKFCSRHWVSYPQLYEQVTNALMCQIKRGLSDRQKEILRNEAENIALHMGEGITKLWKELAQQQTKNERYCKGMMELYLDGMITKEQFLHYQQEYKEKRIEFQKKMEQYEQQDLLVHEKKEAYLKWAEALIDGELSDDREPSVFACLLDKIEVAKDGNLTLCYTFAEKRDI